jgi:hypothetical protein
VEKPPQHGQNRTGRDKTRQDKMHVIPPYRDKDANGKPPNLLYLSRRGEEIRLGKKDE